jgi:hypothetical protein
MSDIVQRIVFDDSAAIESLNQLSEVVEKTGKDFTDFNNDMANKSKKAGAESAKGVKTYEKSLADAAKAQRENQKGLGSMIAETKVLGVSINGIVGQLKQYVTGLKNTLSLQKLNGELSMTQKRGVVQLSTALGGGRTALAGFATGLNIMKAALISTGIGALVVALGSLVAFFTKTERGINLVQRASAALGIVFAKITDAASTVGEKIFDAFKNPQQAIQDLGNFIVNNIVNRFKALLDLVLVLGKGLKALVDRDFDGLKQAGKDGATAMTQLATGLDKVQQAAVKDGMKTFYKDVENAVIETDKLTKDLQALDRLRIKAIVKESELNAALQQQRNISQDTSRSLKERLQAAEKAFQLENSLAAQNVKIAKEAFRIESEKATLAKNLKEDNEDLAKAEASVNNARAESARTQIRLNGVLNGLLKEALDKYESIGESVGKLAAELGVIDTKQLEKLQLNKEIRGLERAKQELSEINEATPQILSDEEASLQISIIDKVIEAMKNRFGREVPESFEAISTGFLREMELIDVEIEKLNEKQKRQGIDLSDQIEKYKRQKEILELTQLPMEQLRKELKEISKFGFDTGTNVSEQLKKYQEAIDKQLGLEPLTAKLNLKVEIFDTEEENRNFFQSILDDLGKLGEQIEDFFNDPKVSGFLDGAADFWFAYANIASEAFDLQISEYDKLLNANRDRQKELEKDYDRELELQKLGLANSADLKRQEVETLLAEEERLQLERDELNAKAERAQILSDTIQQGSSLVTAASNIFAGFSKIPIVGPALGIAAIAKMFAFFAKTKVQALKATRLYKGADQIDDYFGMVAPKGKTDIPGRGTGYAVVDPTSGKDMGVRISGREQILPEFISQKQKPFFDNLKAGMYNYDIAERLAMFDQVASKENMNIVNQSIMNLNVPNKMWVTFKDKRGRQGAKLMEIPKNQSGSIVWFDM